MPGICGVFADWPVDRLDKILTGLLTPLASGDHCRSDRFVSPGAALGRVHLGVFNTAPQPLFSFDRKQALLFYGEIFSGLPAAARDDQSTPQQVLEQLQRGREPDMAAWNGSFVFASYDFTRKRLLLGNDRYGLRPLYFATFPGGFAFSGSVRSLLSIPAVPRTLNEEALGEFLTLGYLLGNHTLFSGVHLLPPAALLTWEKGPLRVQTYWQADFTQSSRRWRRGEACSQAALLLQQTVERQTRSPKQIGLFLSGGLDSRVLAATARRCGRQLSTFTFDYWNSPERELAARVAQAVQMSNEFLPLTRESYWSQVEAGVRATDGQVNCRNFMGIETNPAVSRKTPVVFSGTGGNAVFGYLSFGILSLLFPWSHETFAARFYRRLATGLNRSELVKLWGPRRGNVLWERGWEGFRRVCAAYRDQPPLVKISRFFFDQMHRRMVFLGLVADHSFLEYRLPLYDYDLVDFMLSMPERERLLARFYRRLLTTHFPEVAVIPYSRTGLPVPAGTSAIFWHKGLQLLLRRAKALPIPLDQELPEEWQKRMEEKFNFLEKTGFQKPVLNQNFSSFSGRKKGLLLTLGIFLDEL